MPEFTGHRDLRSYMRTIWRRKFLILVLVLAPAAIAYVVESSKTKLYRSTATVSVSQQVVNSPALSNTETFPATNVQAIAQLVTTTSVAAHAARILASETAGTAVGGVSANANVQTDNITITAVRSDPVNAAEVANAYVAGLRANQISTAKAQLQQAVLSTKAQLAQISKSDANYAGLQDQLLEYEAALKAQYGDISVVESASPNDSPISPHPKRSVELGLVIGILLAVGAVMLLDSVDRRVRTPDDVEQLTQLPLLAAFAPSAFRDAEETSPVDDEAFQTLRTSLTYFTVDRPITSVLIASPGEQEGKSTVAVRLAQAGARAGLDVILVDADLRRAGATAKLGLRPAVGLGLVLAERRPAETALIEVPPGADDLGRLRVLAAGDPPPNPAALISSSQMHGLIATLEDRADLVVVDTPAALAVSDAVPLMQHVSGVVLVARMNRSSQDSLRRLQKIIEAAHGHLLGAVATGVTTGPGYEKYSKAYYSTASRSQSGPAAPPAAQAAEAADPPPSATLGATATASRWAVPAAGATNGVQSPLSTATAEVQVAAPAPNEEPASSLDSAADQTSTRPRRRRPMSLRLKP